MNGDGTEATDPELRVVEELIDEHVRVHRNLIQIDDQTWAIHGIIAVDGEVIMAEFSTRIVAEIALERISAAEKKA
jgi:hypothetical protein